MTCNGGCAHNHAPQYVAPAPPPREGLRPKPPPPPFPPPLPDGICSCPQESFADCHLCDVGGCCSEEGRYATCDPVTKAGRCHKFGVCSQGRCAVSDGLGCQGGCPPAPPPPPPVPSGVCTCANEEFNDCASCELTGSCCSEPSRYVECNSFTNRGQCFARGTCQIGAGGQNVCVTESGGTCNGGCTQSSPSNPSPSNPPLCSSGCTLEFAACIAFGPGRLACRSELDAGSGPLGFACTPGCSVPESPPPPPAGLCTPMCVAEFATCIAFGPGRLACRIELDAGSGPLGSVCTRGCTMPESPPPAPAGQCTPICVAEFENCVIYGPGRSGCLDELSRGTGPLGSVCSTGCTLPESPPPAPARPCSGACASEFAICETFGPGTATCRNEINSGTGPLGAICTPNCLLPESPPPAPATTCSASCVQEFGNCVRFGPGRAVCLVELSQGSGPLGTLCQSNCFLPESPPPAPASECSGGCRAEFDNCVTFGPGALVCRGELDAGVGPLANVCTPGCDLTRYPPPPSAPPYSGPVGPVLDGQYGCSWTQCAGAESTSVMMSLNQFLASCADPSYTQIIFACSYDADDQAEFISQAFTLQGVNLLQNYICNSGPNANNPDCSGSSCNPWVGMQRTGGALSIKDGSTQCGDGRIEDPFYFSPGGGFPQWSCGGRSNIQNVGRMWAYATRSSSVCYASPPPPPSHAHGPHSHSPHSHTPHSHTPHSHGPHSHSPHGHSPHSHGPHAHGPHAHSPHAHTPCVGYSGQPCSCPMETFGNCGSCPPPGAANNHCCAEPGRTYTCAGGVNGQCHAAGTFSCAGSCVHGYGSC